MKVKGWTSYILKEKFLEVNVQGGDVTGGDVTESDVTGVDVLSGVLKGVYSHVGVKTSKQSRAARKQ